MAEDIGIELHDKIKAAFDVRCGKDSTLTHIKRKIENGTATMEDTSIYARRLGELLRKSIESTTKPDDLPGEKMYFNIAQSILEPLLRGNYEDVNGICAEVQRALDAKKGIGIAPQKADFPAERIRAAIGGAAVKETAEHAIQVLGRTAENITGSFQTDYIKKNAEFRSKAGLNCYIERKDGHNCCKWCAGLAGRYRYPDEVPKDVYRRHDNCTCDVSYVSEKGRQNVHTRQWANEQAKAQRIEYAASVPKPMKLTKAEAQALESRLIASKPGKNDNAIADMKFINSQAFADKFKGKYENEQVEQAVVKACRQVVKNRNGTFFEEAFFIDAQTGRTVSYVKGKKKNGVEMSEELKKHLTNAREKSIIMIHNHPNSSPLSSTDYLTASSYNSLYETVACGHNGDVYVFRNTYNTQGEIIGYYKENGKTLPYYEGTRDFFIANEKYQKIFNDYEARHRAWTSTSAVRGFIYEKR